MPLTTQNIESELSHAYLHAVCAASGMSCEVGGRHSDNTGIDARITFRGDLPHPYIRHTELYVQLKATKASPAEIDGKFSYFFQGMDRYNRWRTDDTSQQKILVVLFLPPNSSDWMVCSPEQLIMKKAAYWTSLYGAPESENSSGQTIYIPRNNILTPEGLRILVNNSVQNRILYEG